MPTVDHEHHDLVFRVAVMGGASQQFCDGLPLKDGELASGDVQGWHPRFQLEQFPLDPWSADGEAGQRLEQLVPYLDALVLTDAYAPGTHYSSSAVERLSRVLRPTRIGVPTVIYGGPALALEWETLSGFSPIAVVDPSAGKAMEAIKPLAKTLLRSNMKSTPPPPPTG